MEAKIEKPKKKKITQHYDDSMNGFDTGYNAACDVWETYHNEVVASTKGCGGDWKYDPMRDVFTNQMGDIRGERK